jgi:uncharacterized protein (TIGR04222 family)
MADWLLTIPGPQFLVLFVMLCVVCTFICSRFVNGGNYVLPDVNNVDPIHFAVLRGGWQAAIDVAAVGLIERNIIGIKHANGERMLYIKTETTELSEIEKIIYNYLKSAKGQFGFDGEEIKHETEVCLQPVYRELERQHLWKTENDYKLGYRISLIMIMALELLATAKLQLGLTYHKPVGFLVMIMLAAGILMCGYLRPIAKRTSIGERYIKQVTMRLNWLPDNIKSGEKDPSLQDYVLGVAVFGVGILLLGGMLGDYQAFALSDYDALLRKNSAGDSTSVSDSSGSDSGSSSGSSDGGGCGGGCGGCGGS